MIIDKYLEENRISRCELANRLGVTKQAMTKIFNNPREETIRKIANALGLQPWELLFISDREAIDAKTATDDL